MRNLEGANSQKIIQIPAGHFGNLERYLLEIHQLVVSTIMQAHVIRMLNC